MFCFQRSCMQSRGGGLEPRTAIAGSFSAWGGLGKLDRGLGRGEPFFPDSDSNSDSDETFQISRKLGRVHIEFFCFLDSQPWLYLSRLSLAKPTKLNFFKTPDSEQKLCTSESKTNVQQWGEESIPRT
jgi:hypothetical protein